MRTQKRLEKISTAISLLGLALGFSALGLLIVAKEHDDGVSTRWNSWILLGAAFLIAVCVHFSGRGSSSSEVVSEMRQPANAICSF
jgi:peptidoglycan/LPS O-acetylase OafA/YrhL